MRPRRHRRAPIEAEVLGQIQLRRLACDDTLIDEIVADELQAVRRERRADFALGTLTAVRAVATGACRNEKQGQETLHMRQVRALVVPFATRGDSRPCRDDCHVVPTLPWHACQGSNR